MAAQLISEGLLTFEAVFAPDSWVTDDDIYLAYEILNIRRIRDILSLPDD